MSRIKYAAMKGLAALIHERLGDAIAAHDIVIQHADPEKKLCLPSLVIGSETSWEFLPWQEDERKDSSTDTLLTEVGEFNGDVRLTLGATNAFQREDLEQGILDLFLEQEGRPGIVVVQVDGIELKGRKTLYTAPCAFMLNEETWNEEQVFDKKRYSYIDLEVSLPALVLRTGVYEMDPLMVAITHDLTSVSPTVEEIVTVLETGEITQ